MTSCTGPGQAGSRTAAPAYRLSSVDHALELLLLFRSRPALRVSEVAEELNVARSTAHRLLGMLVHRQFAVQDPLTRSYRPGPRLVEIGLAAVGALDLRTRMRPYLAEVASRTGETVSLLVLEGDRVHFIDSMESWRTVRVGSRLDARMPAHATSAGKAMLAALPTDEVLASYPAEKLATVTSHTIATRTRLLAALDRVRTAGFAVNLEESETGLVAVGMAMLGADGRPAAGLTVAAPTQRMTPEWVRVIAVELRAPVAAASAELCQVQRGFLSNFRLSSGPLLRGLRVSRDNANLRAPVRMTVTPGTPGSRRQNPSIPLKKVLIIQERMVLH